jgi:hypothetical protein
MSSNPSTAVSAPGGQLQQRQRDGEAVRLGGPADAADRRRRRHRGGGQSDQLDDEDVRRRDGDADDVVHVRRRRRGLGPGGEQWDCAVGQTTTVCAAALRLEAQRDGGPGDEADHGQGDGEQGEQDGGDEQDVPEAADLELLAEGSRAGGAVGRRDRRAAPARRGVTSSQGSGVVVSSGSGPVGSPMPARRAMCSSWRRRTSVGARCRYPRR